jgi:thioredoxin-related protein
MKTKVFTLSILIVSLLVLQSFVENEMLEIGANIPSPTNKFLNIDDKEYSFNDLNKENGLLVIFSCNTCPFVIGNGSKSEGWENRYPELGNISKDLDVGMVLINSNAAKRDGGDSFKDMQERYLAKGYNSYYVLDKNSEMADAFGALTTPHVYLFDKNMKLVYRGAIDDNVSKSSDVKELYLQDALNNMVAGKSIEPQTTRQLGCSIKRK